VTQPVIIGDATLRLGDCLEVMRDMADASVDAIVTDPPYELGFMGKGWDSTGIANNPALWREALRVLKPGGHLLAFSGTRTQHRMVCAIEDAGFEIRDQIGWLYGSGFPKSLDVSKAIDKMGGRPWSQFASLLDKLIKDAGFNYTTLDRALGIPSAGSNSCYWVRTDDRGGLPPRHYYERLKELLSPPSEFTDLYDKAEREVIAIERRKNAPSGIVGMGRESVDIDRQITAPATQAAHQWQGWGTALKPAWEPICVARKPLIGTVAANVLQFGTGALNIAGCLIPVSDSSYARNCAGDRGHSGTRSAHEEGVTNLHVGGGSAGSGRWPANVIHDGSDEVLALFPVTTSGGGPKPGTPRTHANTYGKPTISLSEAYGSHTGSAARFYYCAKASREDRNEGCEAFEKKPLNWSSGTQNPGSFQAEGTDKTSQNFHPTVKPTDLMAYLCRLVTPPRGIVLDPFMGSGSTGKACAREGFRFIGIEKEADYLAIAKARIEHEAKKPRQAGLFDGTPLKTTIPQPATITAPAEECLDTAQAGSEAGAKV